MAYRTNRRNPGIRLLLASMAALSGSGCSEAPQPVNQVTATPVDNAAAKPVLPVPLPVPLPALTRRDLIAAASAAADAVAGATTIPASNAALLGRSFAVRLPFGCDGPGEFKEDQWAGWSINPESGALKLSARSELSAADPWVRAIGGDAFETVEGFWVRRPWTSAESCPARSAGDAGPAEAETLALIQLFSADAPRTRQRGNRPWTSTIKAAEEEREGMRQFRLLLEGRVTGYADRQPVHCSQSAPSLRPRCAIAVEFTRIAFEDARDGGIVAEWRY